jgi:FKBP-type peptidyl-prolyl isomerase-like protein
VLRRLRRPAAAAIGAVLLTSAVAACGDSSDSASDAKPSKSASASSSTSSSAGASDELSEVSFDGEVGKSLTSTWHSAIDAPESTTVTTLVKGTGDEIADGDTISAFLYLGDGTTQKDAFSDYDNGSPESIPNDGQAGAVFAKIFEGATYGSRVAAVTTPSELFGASGAQGNPQLGIGANDALVVVADLVEKAAVAPTPTDDKAHDASPDSQPKVTVDGDKVTGLDWTGVDEPDLATPVQRVVLKEGTGAEVKDSDTVTVNYFGEVYQAKEPFDESYSKTPLTSPLSSLIKGWTIGLTGVKVGSRVLLQIPPDFGYGAEGSGDSIPPNSTLWFVIDVVSVK